MPPKHSSNKRAIIIGGSMAGLFCGLSLLEEGWQVDIFERVPVALDGRGAGIVTHEELFEALRILGIAVDSSIGISVLGRIAFARDGSPVQRNGIAQIVTSWGRLYEILNARFPQEHYHRGADYLHCTQEGGRVAARFADGRVAEGDLLIGADGFRSQVRAQFEPDCQPLYVGYVAWRGLVEETSLSPETHRDLIPYFSFCLPPGEQMLGYPVAGEGNETGVGQRRYNFVWYRPADGSDTLPWLLTDRDGQTNEVSIAPNRIHPEVTADLRQAARALLSPQFCEVVDKTAQPFLQPIYDLAVSSMVRGRVVLAGDAAFVARPHVGMGVTKAAGDALCLARLLAGDPDIDSALVRYQAERSRFGARVVARARELGAYMQAQIKTPQERRQAETHRNPEMVLRETGTSDFLRRTPIK